ncbi:hypothetical protein [uncultured Alsobacter sp.]|uniref:hypothetical protein n=1 Tax=uncultured Alsobacter sp. TaxID=1748258 RepID=UPI0025ED9642|nr:hypothetical protein [uncultured Alsobacter sp.]
MTDKPFITAIVEGGRLRPASRYDAEQLARYDNGAKVNLRITAPRHGGRHRLYWATLQTVFETLPEGRRFPSVQALHDAIKIELGVVNYVATLSGEILVQPGSTSFDKMAEPEFREFLDRALELISTELMPGVNPDDIRRETAARYGKDAA